MNYVLGVVFGLVFGALAVLSLHNPTAWWVVVSVGVACILGLVAYAMKE